MLLLIILSTFSETFQSVLLLLHFKLKTAVTIKRRIKLINERLKLQEIKLLQTQKPLVSIFF